MIKTRSVLLLTAVMCVQPLPAGGRTGFEGKWVIDGKNSNTPKMIEALTQEFKNDGSDIKVLTRWREPKDGITPILYLGIMSTDFKLTTDGSEVVNDVGPYEHRSKTTLEGNRMVSEWTAAMREDAYVIGRWVRTLSEDGKTLTLQINTEASDGRVQEAKLVFRKK